MFFLQIFCDKGAERKARDEERRAQKRRATNSGKRRLDELYHTAHERSDFYSMADIHKPPILFTPTQDPDKAAIDFGTELPRCVIAAVVMGPRLRECRLLASSLAGGEIAQRKAYLYSPALKWFRDRKAIMFDQTQFN